LTGKIEGNSVKRLLHPEQNLKVRYSLLPANAGFYCSNPDFPDFAIVDRVSSSIQSHKTVLKVDDVSSIHLAAKSGKWILPKPTSINDLSPEQVSDVDSTLASWRDKFNLRE